MCGMPATSVWCCLRQAQATARRLSFPGRLSLSKPPLVWKPSLEWQAQVTGACLRQAQATARRLSFPGRLSLSKPPPGGSACLPTSCLRNHNLSTHSTQPVDAVDISSEAARLCLRPSWLMQPADPGTPGVGRLLRGRAALLPIRRCGPALGDTPTQSASERCLHPPTSGCGSRDR